jgi:asparagine synthase (glutamine-hydrolysing)
MLWNYLSDGRFKEYLHERSSLKNSPASASIYLKSLLKLAAEHALSPATKDRLASRYRPELTYFSKEARRRYAGLLNLAGEFSDLPLNALLHQYVTGYYLKNLLRWEDRCSMQYSIESRTPFADDIPLIESVFSMPSSFKIRSGWSKSLLREAMKGILPEPVRLRTDKLGFATPQSDWLISQRHHMKEMIMDLIPQDDTGIIDHQHLLKDWDRIFSSPSLGKARDFSFRYLNFLIWKNRFFNT